MAGADRMTIEEVVKEAMVHEHGDVVRAALEAVPPWGFGVDNTVSRFEPRRARVSPWSLPGTVV